MTTRGQAMGGHQSADAGTTDWLTPPAIIGALGGADSFDLDPCASLDQLWPMARAQYTVRDDGLALPWDGRVYLNHPYSTGDNEKWLARLAEHDCGTALIFARTETDAFFRHVWLRASAVLFIRKRLHFHVPRDTTFKRKKKLGDGWTIEELFVKAGDPTPANSGAPSVLVAYGRLDMDVLAYCGIDGQFIPLRLPRSVLVEAMAEATGDTAKSWRALVEEFLTGRDGPVEVAELYRAFADHPKAKANAHYREKLRQTLQRGEGESFRNVGRGKWERAS